MKSVMWVGSEVGDVQRRNSEGYGWDIWHGGFDIFLEWDLEMWGALYPLPTTDLRDYSTV